MTWNITLNDQTLMAEHQHQHQSGGSLLRSTISLYVGTDTSFACLKTLGSSLCNDSFPFVPVPSSAACWPTTV